MRMRYVSNGSSLALDTRRCSGCARCVEVCPHAVFVVDGRRAVARAREDCMECGACARNCPAGAISVRSGVGCADAVLRGMLRGTSPDCGCGPRDSCCG